MFIILIIMNICSLYLCKFFTMARHKKNRIIQIAPHFNGFNPTGNVNPLPEVVEISFEEYEALKLCDYELMHQSEAAQLMQVSRPTFTRIYESVRRKLARAFIEGRTIAFINGEANAGLWYHCGACCLTFSANPESLLQCPICLSHKVIPKTS